MQKTLDLSMKLCTIAWNAYPAIALPGSALYVKALEKGYDLPVKYSGYSFHSHDTLPLPTKHLSPAQVLRFRDEAFNTYHTHPPFLEKVRGKFGDLATENIKDMAKIKLRRDIVSRKKI